MKFIAIPWCSAYRQCAGKASYCFLELVQALTQFNSFEAAVKPPCLFVKLANEKSFGVSGRLFNGCKSCNRFSCIFVCRTFAEAGPQRREQLNL